MHINSVADNAPVTWSVVIPVKVLAQAKSRLGGLGTQTRVRLALAMAADTVAAVLQCPEVTNVIVITDDQVAREALDSLGATVINDTPASGLNAALRHGAAYAASRWPGTGLAALFADLPAVRPAEISQALRSAAGTPNAFVADAGGDGTTLYTARPGTQFRPRFGAASRARHAADGATELTLAGIPGLRRDVDTPADLDAAAQLGLGARTRQVADGLRCAPRDRSACG